MDHEELILCISNGFFIIRLPLTGLYTFVILVIDQLNAQILVS